jgi:hypothetical protein
MVYYTWFSADFWALFIIWYSEQNILETEYFLVLK